MIDSDISALPTGLYLLLRIDFALYWHCLKCFYLFSVVLQRVLTKIQPFPDVKTESSNHRIAQVGKDLKDHQVQPQGGQVEVGKAAVTVLQQAWIVLSPRQHLQFLFSHCGPGDCSDHMRASVS